MKTLLSYHNNPELKSRFAAEIVKHRKADQIEQGHYGKENGEWKGCAVACSLRSLAILDGEELKTEYSYHKDYEDKLGIPEWLAKLEDGIFEGLSVQELKTWPERFAKAIPVGANLEPVKWHFCSFILRENIERVLTLTISDDLKKQLVNAIRGVLIIHENAIKTGKWSVARSVTSAAWSAASAARSAESAARSTAYSRYADELLTILQNTK